MPKIFCSKNCLSWFAIYMTMLNMNHRVTVFHGGDDYDTEDMISMICDSLDRMNISYSFSKEGDAKCIEITNILMWSA